MQLGFFGVGEASIAPSSGSERTELGHGAWVEVRRGWLLGADTLCDELVEAVPWRHNRRFMYERVVDEPRLTKWYGPGDDLPSQALDIVGEQLAQLHKVTLIGPGLNYYRDGRDSVAFHADRELRYLDSTIVAIVTLGATRPFLVRPLGGGRSLDFRPGSGDLLVMGGTCQKFFEHAVPKVASSGPRVSASWRWAAGPRLHAARPKVHAARPSFTTEH
ncbi:MAG TPA: alpha-ketoglutarate-dependent dioxygenase AlkB [Acidimicrobiales bacterium]|nr:alpha-ketoglutarate-dependent dioxygenase AlkB [Acidimicrobiales bacterium]